MKIAIGPYGGGSGISTYTSELCKALATIRNDLDITLLTWQGIDYPDAKFPTLTLPKNTFLGMSDFTGGPFAKVLGATRVVRQKMKDFDLVHFPDSTYGAFIRHPRLVLTTWGYFSWRLLPRWYAERFGFPVNIPGTVAAIEFMAMNTLALRTARVIVSLLPLRYLPKGHIRENLLYIPPPLAPSETSIFSSSRDESDTRTDNAVIVSDIPAHYMVRDHETGRVVLRNSDSIHSAMLELTDYDIRLNLGKIAAKEVSQLTSPTEVAKKYSTVYHRVLSS